MEQAKKDCILAAAAKAFSRFGFKKASVDEIAKEAGVAKGTVYLACDTKEDLFYQSVHREVRAWQAAINKLIDPRMPADQLLILCGIESEKYIQDRPLVRELLFGSHQIMLPEWAERLEELREVGRGTIVEVLQLGIKQGIFRGDLDVEEVARILQDVEITTHLHHQRVRPHPDQMARRLTAAIDVLMNGLRNPAQLSKSTGKTKVSAERS